ncbi:uncharacterized protein LOC110827036 [Zootermopsis nevadensis]|uniref:uncharacterized protein LOC110827036 n=1 Tax=Zootermopsis nevadensis TaxID=136037 RepID=UPI000B8E44BB|nr:uncharacterized protein LOC110827036 [Zootermopsis nevadensis]
MIKLLISGLVHEPLHNSNFITILFLLLLILSASFQGTSSHVDLNSGGGFICFQSATVDDLSFYWCNNVSPIKFASNPNKHEVLRSSSNQGRYFLGIRHRELHQQPVGQLQMQHNKILNPTSDR